MRAGRGVLLALVLALTLAVGADAKGAERLEHLLDKAFWIWSDRDIGYWRAGDVGGEVTFTRDYTIAGKVESAVLRITADSNYALFINGKEVGSDDHWQTLDTYDVRPYLVQGNNKFLVKARGKGLFVAGAVDFADGKGLEMLSDVSWRCRSDVDGVLKPAEPVVRGVNGGWWTNCNRLMEMPEVFYRLNTGLEAPGIAWGKGYPGGRLRVLAVHPRNRQRDTVEILHRTDMDITAVFCDFQQDWENIYRGASAQPFFPNVKGHLRQDVAAALAEALERDYDLVLLGPIDGELFHEVMAERLKEMVGAGTGLVYTGIPARDGYEQELTKAALEEGPPFLLSGTPFSRLPGFKLGEGDDEGYQRVASLYQYGKGRVVKLNMGGGYGLLGNVADPVELHYEYYVSFVIKSLLWAAGREPQVELTDLPTSVAVSSEESAVVTFGLTGSGKHLVRVAVRSPKRFLRVPSEPTARPGVHESGALLEPICETMQEVEAGGQVGIKLPPLPAGEYYVDIEVERPRGALLWRSYERVNWGTVHLSIASEATIVGVHTDPVYIDVADGKQAKLTATARLSDGVAAGAVVRFQLIDNHERLLQAQEVKVPEGAQEARVEFTIARFDTTLGLVRAELMLGDRVQDVAVGSFTAVRRDWDRFFFILYSGDDSVNSKTGLVLRRVYAGLGVDAIRYSIPGHAALEAADMVAIPSHGGFSRRPIDLSDETFEKVSKNARATAERALAVDPLTYTQDDEIVYGGGEELPERVEFLRGFLRERYGEIDALNAQWDTTYASFDAVYPVIRGEVPEGYEGKMITDADFMKQALETRNYSRLVDQWLSHIAAWYHSSRTAHDAIKPVDPYARLGTGCMMWPHATSGHDWYSFVRGFGMFAPYGLDAYILPYEEARSFARPDTFLGMYYGGYLYNAFVRREEQTDLEWQHWRVWTALLRGFSSIWWYAGTVGGREGAFGPGLMPNPSFQVLSDQIGQIRQGFYPLFDRNKAPRDYGPIAVHYSIASRLASRMLPGFGAGNSGHNFHVQFLHHLLADYVGHQYTFVADEQIVSGALDDYKVLIMPLSVAVSAGEAAALKKFVQGGGLLIADVRAGVTDGYGRFRSGGVMEELFGISYDLQLGRRMVTADLSGEYLGVPIRNIEQKFPADPAVRLKGATALFEVDGIPLVTYNKVGAGTAVSFNIPFNYYKGFAVPDTRYYYIGEPGHNRMLANILGAVLEAHGIEGPVRVTRPEGGWLKGLEPAPAYETERWLPGLEIPYHVDGRAQYVSLTKRRVHKDEAASPVSLELARAGHWYDALAGKYLGHSSARAARIEPGGIKIFSVLPYRVRGLKVSLDKSAYRVGEDVRGSVSIDTGGVAAEMHVVHLQAVRPDGEIASYTSQALETAGGKVSFALPLALNEPAGRWKLEFIDTATGTQETVKIRVRR
ncbi:MAG: beta-galactosidase trimerization domain-containing protein [Candidatus Brocadiia bacterium]|nr:beta-galactosidase trimerization domain-containing protein [Candidatus Brocadiia bacterium]